MDIWNWVYSTTAELREQGQARLAEIVDRVPELVCDNDHERAEALAAEGLVLARAIDHAWLEVFLRHWVAQSRILHRSDVTQGMDEVIRLLDFAHSERTQDCPQSICVTQDVCSAYEKLDGPGYADERLSASDETLRRIDASWPCFTCISSEYASALLHKREAAAAEQFCREQQRQLTIAGQSVDSHLNSQLVDSLIMQAKLSEAAAQLLKPPQAHEQKSVHREYRLQQALVFSRLGRIAEARAAFDAVEGLEPSDYLKWARVALSLCEAGALENTRDLGSQLYRYSLTLKSNGSLFDRTALLIKGAELALQRSAFGVARLLVDEAQTIIPTLRAPQRLIEKISQLAPRIAALSSPDADIEAILSDVGRDAEKDVERLEHLYSIHGADERVPMCLADTYRSLGFGDRAIDILRNHFASQPASIKALDALLRAAVAANNSHELQRLVASVPTEQRGRALYYQAREFRSRNDWASAILSLEQALLLDPQVTQIRMQLADLYKLANRWDDALAAINLLLSESDLDAGEVKSLHWDRMVVATKLSEYALVRNSAKALEFDFSGDGPIDQPIAYCDIRTHDRDGKEISLQALRISPVTARITSVTGPMARERYHDIVLFEPVSLNPRPAEGAEAQAEDGEHVHEFREIETLSEGGYTSFDIDGAHPGIEFIEQMRIELQPIGAVVSIRSTDQYRVCDPGTESEIPGIYIYIAMPGSQPPSELCDRLRRLTTALEKPLTYRGLLKAVAADVELQLHEKHALALRL